LNVDEAIKLEQEAPAGMLEIRFYTPTPISKEQLQAIADKVTDSGADVRDVYLGRNPNGGLYYVGVQYMKQPASASISALPLAIIPLIAFGMIAALVGIGIFKLEDIANNIGKLLLILLGGTIVLAVVLKKPIENVTSRR
jgi:hypothetical protein